VSILSKLETDRATRVPFSPSVGIPQTDVQRAVEAVLAAGNAALAAHLADATDAHDASAISVVPAGSLAATDVQAALLEILGDIEAHVADASDAHDASAISFSATGGIAATDVQAAIAELDAEKLNASTYTAADVLSKLLTVDGSGSGLDADLLDGLERSASGNRWGVIPFVETDGVMEVGRYIDFHNSDGDTGDSAVRLDTNGGTSDLYVNTNIIYRASGTDVPVTDGGTGASTAAGARASLGAVNIAGDTMTGALTLNPGNSTANADWFTLQPTDFASNKPKFIIKKGATAELYEIGLWDGADTNGTVNFFSQPTYNSSNLLTTATGIAQGKTTVWVPAGAMIARTTNGAASVTTESTTNKVMTKSLDFDQTTQEFAQFVVAMPKSWDEGTVTFVPYWTAAAGSGGVVWSLAGLARSDDDAIDTAFGSAQTSTDRRADSVSSTSESCRNRCAAEVFRVVPIPDERL
jgi:hypothetical protein